MDQAKLARMQASVRIVVLGFSGIGSERNWSLKPEDMRHPTRTSLQIAKAPETRRQSRHEILGSFGNWNYFEFFWIIGKGTPRRKVKKVHKSSGADDKKLQATLKKMNVQPIQAIEEVNMFKEDGNVIHFGAPKVHASVPSNTFALYGNGEEKELTELVPGILNQLGPDSLASLRKLAESYQNMQKNQAGAEGKKDDEDDIPDLVEGENFESNVE
ncbi:nascent polypeptide-associated complex (NAC) subunit [Aspergillus flavus]|nr:nascent polypeptide-associated complex (NAC) subunit [Aspergillus flavus]RAQ75917.1 nascent polypeptide-associated complex (NAC) subunit [Aspergillus flavus]